MVREVIELLKFYRIFTLRASAKIEDLDHPSHPHKLTRVFSIRVHLLAILVYDTGDGHFNAQTGKKKLSVLLPFYSKLLPRRTFEHFLFALLVTRTLQEVVTS